MTYPFLGVLAYSVIYIPMQPYEVWPTAFDMVEVVEIILLVTVFGSLVSTNKDVERIFACIKYASVIESILFFSTLVLFDRSYVQIFDFGTPPGFPVVGMTGLALTLVSLKIIIEGRRLDAIILFLLSLRVVFQFTRSLYVFPIISIIITLAFIRKYDIYTNNRVGSLVFSATLLVTISIFFWILPREVVYSTKQEIYSIFTGESGLLTRPVVWYASVKTLSYNPLGAGLGNSKPAMITLYQHGFEFKAWFVSWVGPNTINNFLAEAWQDRPSGHSSLVNFTICLGVLGPILFVSIWYKTFKQLIKNIMNPLREEYKKHLTYSFGVLIYFLLISLGNSTFLNGYGALFAVLVSTITVFQRRKEGPAISDLGVR